MMVMEQKRSLSTWRTDCNGSLFLFLVGRSIDHVWQGAWSWILSTRSPVQ